MKTYAVVGLGYVGLGLAVSLGRDHVVLGYDINQERILELQKRVDLNQQVDNADLSNSKVVYTSHLDDIANRNFLYYCCINPCHFL